MKKALLFITILFFSLMLMTACGSTSNAPEVKPEEEEIKTAVLYLDVNFEENIILNKYDVYVDLNGERLGEIKHGDYFTHMAEVPWGDYTIKFINTERASVTASKDLTIERDTTYKCTIHTDKDEIVIKDEEVIEGIEGSSLKIPDVVGTNLSTAKEELETIGFVNIEEKASDDSTILMESNWVIIEQSVEPETELDKNHEIVLTCRKETELFNEAYNGLNLADAKKKASGEGFSDFELKEDSAYTKVTKRLENISGEEAGKWIVTDASKASDTKVRFYLSYTGEVTVPDVVGMTVKDAKKALQKQYAFNIDTEDPNNFWVYDDETWKVTKQSIEAGKTIKYSDKITLTCREITQKEQSKQVGLKDDNQSKETSKQTEKERESKKESKNKSKLEAFVGKRCFDATDGIKNLGYEPCYIAANTGEDMTSQIIYEHETNYNDNKWIIANMTDIDEKAKIVTYIVTSQWMRDSLF